MAENEKQASLSIALSIEATAGNLLPAKTQLVPIFRGILHASPNQRSDAKAYAKAGC
jgi:hypothetical protein